MARQLHWACEEFTHFGVVDGHTMVYRGKAPALAAKLNKAHSLRLRQLMDTCRSRYIIVGATRRAVEDQVAVLRFPVVREEAKDE
jgi:hypothetical protein